MENSLAARGKLLGSIFPGNLFFFKEKSRTARINDAVPLILNTRKGFNQQKTGQLFKNLELSGVEVTGQKSNLLEDLKALNTHFT